MRKMKPPFKVDGRIYKVRKNIIDDYLNKNENHTIILCGRVCKYDPKTKTYVWWQYDGHEVIKATGIWGTIKKYNEQGKAVIFSN